MKQRQAKQDSISPRFDELELITGGVRLVSITFGITLYTSELFSKHGEAVLACFEMYRQLCPKDQLTFYGTANMRMHKPVTERVLRMPSVWFRPGAPPLVDVGLVIKNGAVYQDAPTFAFEIYGGEEGSFAFQTKGANVLKMCFPADWGVERATEMYELTRALATIFPFQSGQAGYSFECSRYAAEASQTHAWSRSMRHRGIDISRIPQDNKCVGHDAIKGVNWLTLLGMPFIEKLGGSADVKRSLGAGVGYVELERGAILRAGEFPATGDTNRGDLLPLYQQVYRVVQSLVEVAAERSVAFNLEQDFVERTESWFRRFANE
jgi:hypothetical protein